MQENAGDPLITQMWLACRWSTSILDAQTQLLNGRHQPILCTRSGHHSTGTAVSKSPSSICMQQSKGTALTPVLVGSPRAGASSFTTTGGLTICAYTIRQGHQPVGPLCRAASNVVNLPTLPVQCLTLPEPVAERLWFYSAVGPCSSWLNVQWRQ